MNPASQIIRSTSALLTVWAMLIPASTAKAAPAGGLDAWQALAEAARQRSPGLTVVVGHGRPGDVRGLAEGFTGPIQLLVEPDRLAVQRKALAALEPAGRVTAAMHRPGSPLPYVQGLVNRLVLLPGAEVSDDQARRVLSPGGERIAVTGDGGVDIERFLIFGKRGAEFLDLRGDEHMRHDWFRGACKYGILPANGLVYAPPHPCFCYPGVKLKGFYALHGQSTGPAGERLLVAGPPDEVADGAEPEAILRGAKGARLLVLDALTGEVLAERALASMPVFDGLIVACRRVYFTAVDGTLVCLGKGT